MGISKEEERREVNACLPLNSYLARAYDAMDIAKTLTIVFTTAMIRLLPKNLKIGDFVRAFT